MSIGQSLCSIVVNDDGHVGPELQKSFVVTLLQ